MAKRSISMDRESTSFCPTLQLLHMCTLSDTVDVNPVTKFSHTLDSLRQWAQKATSFRRAQAGTLLEFHVRYTNCFVCRWFCVVHDPKNLLHRHNWLRFGKFQDTKCFLIHSEHHFSSQLPRSGGTCKYTKVHSTKKKLGEILYLMIC